MIKLAFARLRRGFATLKLTPTSTCLAESLGGSGCKVYVAEA